MNQKDITDKILLDYNDVFADVVNVCVYNGKEVVNPRDLRNTAVHAQYKADDGTLHELERDVAKYWKKSRATIAMYGIENQSSVDKYMPFRIIGYDGASYRSQLLVLEENRKKNKTSEKGVRMRKIVPVASIVLYFGTKRHWPQKKSIKELMQIPEGLEEFVNDYKIKVIEIAWLTDEQLKKFKSDFGIVANFFVQRRKNKNYIPDDERELKHVDAVLKLLSVMTGDNRYKEVLYNPVSGEKEEVKNMCEVADRLVTKGKEVGLREGKAVGLREGEERGRAMEIIVSGLEEKKTKTDILEKLQKRLDVTSKKAEAYFEMYGKENFKVEKGL